MIKILTTFLLLILSFSSVFGYNLTSRDSDTIDVIADKLIEKIDNNSRLTPEIVVGYIESKITQKKYSDRIISILEVIKDDIEYTYYLGVYSVENNYVYESDYEINESYHGGYHDLGDLEILAKYEILRDDIILISGGNNTKHQKIWDIFTALIPSSQREYFLYFSVTDDGNSDTGAHVEQDIDDNTRWNLSVNLDSFYVNGVLDTKYVYSTLVHEFAHVLTLNNTQVVYYPITDNDDIVYRFEENCQTTLVQEGCLNESSYLDDFIDIFWTDKQYLQQVQDGKINAYIGNKDRFVTEYAATNPGEDIAESFTYFIMQAKPIGTSVSDQKISFFYNYPKLDILRQHIRIGLESIK